MFSRTTSGLVRSRLMSSMFLSSLGLRPFFLIHGWKQKNLSPNPWDEKLALPPNLPANLPLQATLIAL